MMRILFYFLLYFLTITNAVANIECGNESIGKNSDNSFNDTYTEDKIKSLCGSPTKIKTWQEEVLTKNQENFIKNTIHYSEWTYDKGSHTFIEYLTFKDGVLIDVKDGDYGTDLI